MKYRNIHTGDVVVVKKVEYVSNPPIEVNELDDGTRWNTELFHQHFALVQPGNAFPYHVTEQLHRQVIDQMVRILAGDQYTEVIKAARDGQDGPHTYDWDTGIAP